MRPNVGAVEVDEDGNVADYANRFLSAVGTQRMPLLVKKELNHSAGFEIVGKLASFFVEGCRVAVSQFTRPAIPSLQMEIRPQAIKENEIVEPPCLVTAELLETRAWPRGCTSKKLAGSLEDQGHLQCKYLFVIDRGDTIRKMLELRALDPSAIREPLQTDQQRIACEC